MSAAKTQIEKKMLLVPKLRFKGIESIWKKMLYGDIYTFYSTNSFSRDDLNYESGEVKNIHYGDIHTKYRTLFDIQNEEVPFVNSNIDIKKIKLESYCQEGDLVIADASEDYADIGKTIELVRLNNEKVIAGLHTFLARPNKYEMASGFAGYLFQSWKFRKQVMVIAQGTKVLSISTGRLANVKVNIPSLPEQQKIASFLSAVDEKIQQLTREKELLEQYKKGVMQQLFSGKLRFKDESGKPYPKWEEKRLGDESSLIQGDGDWILSENISKGGKYSIIQLGNIGLGVFIDKEMKTLSEDEFKKIKGTLIKPGDLLINRMVDDDKLNVCLFEYDGFYVTSVDVCWIRFAEGINNQFLMYLLTTSGNQKKLLSLSSGSGRVRISKKNFFEKFSFQLPCPEEQHKIASYLSSLDAKIDKVSKQITQIQTFKEGLLQQMFV